MKGESLDLWRRWREQKDVGARDDLIERHLYLVEIIVRRLARGLPAHIDRDDMTSWGMVGLIKAVETFNPEKGALFTSWANTLIALEVSNSFREEDWVPRSVRARQRERDEEVPVIHQVPLDDHTELAERIPDAAPTPEMLVCAKESNELLMQALATLDPIERKVIRKLYFEGKNQKRVAADMDRAAGTIAAIKRRAFRKLKVKLAGKAGEG